LSPSLGSPSMKDLPPFTHICTVVMGEFPSQIGLRTDCGTFFTWLIVSPLEGSGRRGFGR
jgi:hypothetical protein